MPRPEPLRSLPPLKPKKTSSETTKSIQDLEKRLKAAITANSSLNPLVDLLGLACNVEHPQETSKAIHALHGIFSAIIVNGKLSINGADDTKIVRSWICDRLNLFIEFLTSLLADEEKILRVRPKPITQVPAHLHHSGRSLPCKYYSHC